MANYEVSVRLTPETSVQEVSKIFEGLYSLENQGRIALRIDGRRADPSYPRVVRLSVRTRARNAEIAIDLADQPGFFHLPDLEKVDAYFKRSFWRSEVDRLPRELIARVRPFGLNNPTCSPGTAFRMLRARWRMGREPRDLALDARQLLALPRPSAFECSPDFAAEPQVFFQTQVWDPGQNGEQAIEINEERARLVSTLRDAFGSRFVGGIIPTRFAQARYPGLITSLPFSMRAYPRLLKQPLIAIYSRGLHQSVAFKMSEYLASSRCIVGHGPTALLPEMLAEGKNYLSFQTVEDCIARCDQLLSRPREAVAMRRANWQYYEANVEPAAHLHSILERAFRPD